MELLDHQRMNISTTVARQKSLTMRRSLAAKVWSRIKGSKINILLICLPFGAAARFLEWGPGPVFFLNFM